MAQDKKRRSRRQHGYVAKSPAICVVVHDPSGKPLDEGVANEILNAVNEISLPNGYLLNFTRT